MGRAAGPEAERARQERRFVDRLQQQHDRPLRHLVFQRRDAERALRAIRLRDVVPPHRRRDIAARFDARQQVRETGLQLRLVLVRRHAVDARRAILARQTKRLEHPFEVDQVVQRSEHPLRMSPRQFGYPLSFRGQVFGTQSSLPCFPQWS